MKKTVVFILAFATFNIALGQSSNNKPAEFRVSSPDGRISLKVDCSGNKLSYSLSKDGETILENSSLSIISDANYRVLDSTLSEVDETWEPVWGQFSEVRDHCREMRLEMIAAGLEIELVCRVYNDGIGLRFVIPEQSDAINRKVDFMSEYQFTKPLDLYHAPTRRIEHEPIGPIRIGKSGGGRSSMPAVLRADDNLYIGLLESDLYTAKGFGAGTLSFNAQSTLLRASSAAKVVERGLTTPWRVVLLGDNPGDLLVSMVAINLAAPCKLEETDWITAGLGVWDWRAQGYTAPDGFTYAVNTETHIRLIDFAAEHDIPLMELAGIWWHFVDGELTAVPGMDMDRIMSHAEAKDVGIMLYYDHKQGGSLPLEELCRRFAEMGAAGIKYGFRGNNAEFTRQAIDMAAKYGLTIYFHDRPCPMTGVRRTMPNALTREYCHAQQDARKAFSPTGFLKMAMINALSGPLDMANGAFGLDGINRGERKYGPRAKQSYNSTVVSEMARLLVIFSGLDLLPDAPEEYLKKSDLFEFIARMPASWDETRIINSEIGEHITTVRRSGEEWFVGSVIDQSGGMLEIPLDFLDDGVEYEVRFYEDAPDAHYRNNRESYRIRNGKVDSTDIVKAEMAPGGGHCMIIKPL